ncbi:uncharacterized protein LOC122383389 [Amphibalanus amphitrite]|uniref:uncharacterized protein LOC122383389 n=1 Tax=Amphibalanus amphitrite TaxID=1232801 RepID=UPI001C92B6AB|nr:uncharacterized protein LOC122383389 [Amphibalanus amphitrite]
MRIVVDWSQDGAVSPASALSAGSDRRPGRPWLSKGASWLSSVARRSSVRRAQQRLHGWLSSESLLSSHERGRPAAAAAEELPRARVPPNRRASFAEFYPGQLQLGQSHSLPREPEPRAPGRAAPDRFGTMRGDGGVRGVTSDRARYQPLPPPVLSPPQHQHQHQHLRQHQHQHHHQSQPQRQHQQRPARGLYRSVSIAGHLSELSSAAAPAPHRQFARNSTLRRSRSRDDLLSAQTSTGPEPGKMVYHYPPNGPYCSPVVLVSRTAAAPRPGPLRRAESLSHGLKSRSLGTLLEERHDPTPSPSPLPLPVLDLTQVAGGAVPPRSVQRRPVPEEPQPPPPGGNYHPDDLLPPLAEENSSKGSSEGEQERRSSSGRASRERRRSLGADRPSARPQVATFSSPSPESPERPSWTPPRSASPLYSTLEESGRRRDRLADLRLQRGRGASYGGYSAHSGHPGRRAGPAVRSQSFQVRAPVGPPSEDRAHPPGSPGDALPPQLDYPPFVTPEGGLWEERPAPGLGHRPHDAELIRAAYRARFEQRRRFPSYLQPAFVPLEGVGAGSWHERNPLPTAAAPRRAATLRRPEPHCPCHLNQSTSAAAERAWRRRSYADPRYNSYADPRYSAYADPRYSSLLLQNQGNINGEVTTIPGRNQINQARGLSKKNGIIVNERLPVLSGKRPQPNGSSHGSSGRGLPVISGLSPSEQGHGSRTDTHGRPLPLRPSDAVRYYASYMSEYELTEIEQYDEIWFLGLDASKVAGDEALQQNGGFDDEHGSYVKVPHDHIAYRYEILEVIGRGSFGQVIRALDHKTNTQVAIKIIRNKKRFHQQALMEVKILDHLRRRDKEGGYNIIHMLDYFYFRNHLCVTFQLMGLNLFELIKKNNYQGVSMSLIKKFAASMVQCLRLLFREGIIHCDLKPENVLLKSRSSSSIKIIDFGSSCYTHQRVYTYIQSRFYRSPEVILGLQYGTPIDMWSLGCILAELHTGFPLFPGENEVEQLACIMEVLDLPPEDLIVHATRRRLFFDSRGNPRTITNTKGRRRRPGSRPLPSALKTSDAMFVDFIEKCLTWDPSQRLTPEEAARHPFLGGRVSSLPPPPPAVPAPAAAEEPAYSIYKIYRGRRPVRDVAAAPVAEVAAGPPAPVPAVSRQESGVAQEPGDGSESTSVPSAPPVGSTPAQEPSAPTGASEQPPAAPTRPSTEATSEEGGTFLPPIL